MGSVARLSLNFTVSTSAGLLMKIVVIGLLGEEHSACATRAALSGHPPYPLTLSISRRMTLLACGFLAVSESSAWEIWAAGASHAGGSSSPGHSAAVVPVNSVGLLGSPYSQYGTL